MSGGRGEQDATGRRAVFLLMHKVVNGVENQALRNVWVEGGNVNDE